MRTFHLLGVLLAVVAVTAVGWATTTTLNGSYAAPVGGNGSWTEHYMTNGSWQNIAGLPKFEWYFYGDQATFPGQSFTIAQIAGLDFYTKDGVISNPTGLDFYVSVYTMPYVGGDASWYGNRLTGEPMYSYNYNRAAGVWNHWNTATGTNQLAWIDQNHAPIGAYGAPTWQTIQAGPINWQTYYPGSPATNINYANQVVKMISLSTGSGWDASFDGYLDAVSITLTDNTVLTFDLEGNPVHNITNPADYSTLTAALTAAQSGDEIHVDPNSLFYEHDIPITKPVTLIGAPGDASPGCDPNAPIVDGQNLPNNHYGFLFGTGAHDVTISGFEIRNFVGPLNGDGDAFQAWYASTDHVTITDNYMHHIAANGVLVGSDGMEAVHSDWTIARNVLTDFGPPLPFNGTDQGYGLELTNTSNGVIEDNIIDAGSRGPGMAIRVSGRLAYQSNITVSGNQVRGAYERCAIQVNAYDIEAPNATLDGVTIDNNDFEISYAPRIIYLRDDYSGGTAVLTNVGIHDNRLVSTDNGLCVESLTDQTMNASGNWWGMNAPADLAAKMVGPVDYSPWLYNGTDLDAGIAFHGDFSVLYVDDNSPQSGSVGRIQEAIDMVSGSTVNIAAGTYEEQLHITTNNLNLVGAGVGSTFINSPVSLPLYFVTSAPNHPVVWVDGATGVTISDLTVDGLGRASGNSRMDGIAYWNAGGSIHDLHVTNIGTIPYSGVEAVGVYAYNNTPGPYALDITDVAVDNYGKNAFALNGNGNLTVNLLRVSATGQGAINTIAQNGIQIMGATGTVNDCDVADNAWIWTSGTHWSAAGYLLIESDVTVSGGCTGTGNQVNFNFLESSGSITGGTIVGSASTPDYSSGVDVTSYTAGTAMGHAVPQPFIDPVSVSKGSSQLDDPGDETVTIDGVTMTGANPVGSYAVYAYNEVDDMNLNVTNCQITSWSAGLLIQRVSGNISPAAFTNNVFSNTDNAWDNTAGHTYANNCWSDYGSNSGFPVQYNVGGGGNNADYTPGTDCSDMNLAMSSNLIGCEAACRGETLYLTFGGVGYLAGQMYVDLPAGLDATWAADGSYPGVDHVVYPSTNVATRLSFSHARRTSATQIEVDVQWNPSPYSDGDATKYIAAIPLTATGANAHGTDFTISLNPTYTFWDISGPHSGIFTTGVTGLTVDCDDPSATLGGGGGGGSCNAYGTEASFTNALTVSMNALGALGSPVSPLISASITHVGGASYTIPLGDGSWPSGADLTAVWLAMAEGCNSFTMTVEDAECNTVTTAAVSVVKDITDPDPTVTYAQSTCYNNMSGDPQYGGTLLETNLDITLAAALDCQASTFSLSFTVNGTPVVIAGLSGLSNFAGYPDAAQAVALWNAIIGVIGGSWSGPVTIGWTVADCAGNEATGSFSIPCVDFAAPGNTFTLFNARPTFEGVWLDWSWTHTDAVLAEVWRKAESGAGYPTYPNQDWDDFANEYEVNHANLLANGWTMVVSQAAVGAGPTTSLDYAGTHNSTFWNDVVVPRSIYRYVTFVKDQAGNWSSVPAIPGYTRLVNVDRSTNYWLGDFAPMHGIPSSPPGGVNNDDLTLLAGVYFTPAAGHEWADINENSDDNEQGFGRRIPTPDNSINFGDLVPFSFNFGTTAPGSFNVPTPRANPGDAVNAAPVVTVTRANQNLLEVGSEFDVVVNLSGNSNSAVKAVEAMLAFDPQVLELVNVSSSIGDVYDGIPWSTAKSIAGTNDRIGIAAAAMGEIASFVEDFTLATVTFRWIADRTPETSLSIDSYRLADVFGATSEGEGPAITFGAHGMIPTVYALYQNYPNPFNPSTTIRLDLPEAVDVQLVIYNIMGQEVRTLVSGSMPAGAHSIAWNGLDNSGREVGTGMYIYRVSAGPLHDIRKMLLTR